MSRLLNLSRVFRLSALAGAIVLAHSAVADEAQELNALIISASGTEHTQMTAPAFTTVIDEKMLSNNPSQSVADMIGRSAGVLNATDPSGRDELQIRGLPGNYTLVLVDGRRVSSSNALWRGGDFDFSSIPRASIERIEIVRGPMSSLYGADAMGGVINIITKKGAAEWTANFDAMYESVLAGEDGDRWRTNLTASGPLAEDVYVRLSGEVYDRDAWFTDKGDQVPAREEKEARNLSGSLSWDIDNRQTLTADVRVNRDDRPYALYAAGPAFRDQDINRETYGLTHEGDWGWGSTRLSVNYEDGEIADFNTRYPDPQQRHSEYIAHFLQTVVQGSRPNLGTGKCYRNGSSHYRVNGRQRSAAKPQQRQHNPGDGRYAQKHRRNRLQCPANRVGQPGNQAKSDTSQSSNGKASHGPPGGMYVAQRLDAAVLPEPMRTATRLQSLQFGQLSHELDLSQEWARLAYGEPLLPQAGVLCRRELLEQAPEQVAALQAAIGRAVDWVVSEPEAAARLGAERSPLSREVYEGAIARTSLKMVNAQEARPALEAFFSALSELSSGFIGGKLPDAGFYHV